MTGGTFHGKAVNRRVHGLFLLAGLAVLTALLHGCGPKRFEEIRPGLETRGHYVGPVPFYRQTDHACGPAALASVLAYHRRAVDLEGLTRKIVIPKIGGALPMDLERAAKEQGLRTATAHGDRDLLFASLKRDLPVICLLDLGTGPLKQPHYVVLTGFDDGNRLFILHDGAAPDRTMSYERFERFWARGGRWMLVAEPE
jgi:ABC-type bacteriocin/lantibiotic exporter with double-glycine peptidase domain